MNKFIFSIFIILNIIIIYFLYNLIIKSTKVYNLNNLNKNKLANKLTIDKTNKTSKLHKIYDDDNIDIRSKIKIIDNIRKKINKKTIDDYYILGSYYLLYKNDKVNSIYYFNKVVDKINHKLTYNIKQLEKTNFLESSKFLKEHKKNIFILEKINDLENIYIFNNKFIITKTKQILLKYYNYIKNILRLQNNYNQTNQFDNTNQTNQFDNYNQINQFNNYNQIDNTNQINQIDNTNQIKQINQTKQIKQKEIDKNINDKKLWISDSQNVHDSNLTDEFINQFILVCNENNLNNLDEFKNVNYQNIIDYFISKCKNHEEKEKINKVIKILNNNYAFDNNIYEQDILIQIWKRSLDPKNINNKVNIQNALFDNMLDCIENNNVVCIRGRTPKLWQSLALLDYNKNIGILKSKQLIKNEIYESCGKIINETLNKQQNYIINDYNNSKNTLEVQELKNNIFKSIDELKNNYKGKLLDIQLNNIINECKELV